MVHLFSTAEYERESIEGVHRLLWFCYHDNGNGEGYQVNEEMNRIHERLNLVSFLQTHDFKSHKLVEKHQVPFWSLYDLARRIQPRSPTCTSRHGENQVAHLAFVVAQPNSQIADLGEVVSSCISNSYFALSSTIHKALIQLVVDETRAKLEWSRKVSLNIKRHYLPLYFIILYWSDSRFRDADADLVRETCQCDDEQPLSLLKDSPLPIMGREFRV